MDDEDACSFIKAIQEALGLCRYFSNFYYMDNRLF